MFSELNHSSSSKPQIDLEFHSYLEQVDFRYGNDDANKGGGDDKGLDDSNEDEEQSGSKSSSDIGSSDEIAHPFALLEMQ